MIADFKQGRTDGEDNIRFNRLENKADVEINL